MNKLPHGVVSPAYGRDYTSAAEARAEFVVGKDFKLESIHPGQQGTYCSVRDFKPGAEVEVRYCRKEKLVIVVVPTKDWRFE